MKNVLLPTDLTVQSLRPVHEIVKGANGERTTLFVVHLMYPPTSITDLLFINQAKPFSKVPANFKEALELLRSKYEGVLTIVFDFVYCQTSGYFNSFITGHKINEVYMLANYKYRQPMPQSENPVTYINKCEVRVHKLAQSEEVSSSYLNLSALLNAPEQIKVSDQIRSEKTLVTN